MRLLGAIVGGSANCLSSNNCIQIVSLSARQGEHYTPLIRPKFPDRGKLKKDKGKFDNIHAAYFSALPTSGGVLPAVGREFTDRMSSTPRLMRRVGIIGCGGIGAPVIAALQAGRAGEWALAAVLANSDRCVEGVLVTTDVAAFFSSGLDLIVDTAGPDALRQHGVRALEIADLWTVSGTALAEPKFHDLLESTGRRVGHRLRLLSGGIAGLDGIAAASIDENAVVKMIVETAPTGEDRAQLFQGTAREAAKRYPNHANVVVATALAGPGLDAVSVEVMRPAPAEGRTLSLTAQSAFGFFTVHVEAKVVPEERIHTVAASIIASLRRESAVLWAG